MEGSKQFPGRRRSGCPVKSIFARISDKHPFRHVNVQQKRRNTHTYRLWEVANTSQYLITFKYKLISPYYDSHWEYRLLTILVPTTDREAPSYLRQSLGGWLWTEEVRFCPLSAQLFWVWISITEKLRELMAEDAINTARNSYSNTLNFVNCNGRQDTFVGYDEIRRLGRYICWYNVT